MSASSATASCQVIGFAAASPPATEPMSLTMACQVIPFPTQSPNPTPRPTHYLLATRRMEQYRAEAKPREVFRYWMDRMGLGEEEL
jgi:hypothetical protein